MRAAQKKTDPAARSVAKKKAPAFTDEERAAMKERLEEAKAEGRRGSRPGREEEQANVAAKIAEMPEWERAIAEGLDAIIRANAPALEQRTWYGMPAYAKDGNVVCFFQSSQKFKARYALLGFSDKAKLDDGQMWPTAFAVTEMTAEVAARIEALIKKAAG